MDMTSIIAFWPAAVGFLFLVTSDLLLPVPVCGLILVALMTYGRQRLRKGFEMDHGDFKSVCGDCLFVSFCTPCAISQEARHAEKAAEVNHPLVASKRPLEAEATAPAQGAMSQPEAGSTPSPPPAAAAAPAPAKKEEPKADKGADSDEEF
ncbi:CNR10 [Symbiodinium pilosum]|uniref:CNR10 protein n=1 Tax=Symbiodinium pilosum TaxID=2952 RepID=A0A812Y6S4_SYMPI|nr:CNR10 [Symbiodinium pilosum]